MSERRTNPHHIRSSLRQRTRAKEPSFLSACSLLDGAPVWRMPNNEESFVTAAVQTQHLASLTTGYPSDATSKTKAQDAAASSSAVEGLDNATIDNAIAALTAKQGEL